MAAAGSLIIRGTWGPVVVPAPLVACHCLCVSLIK